MDRLMAWLKAHVPVADETTIAHDDDRLGNLIIHPDGPQGIGKARTCRGCLAVPLSGDCGGSISAGARRHGGGRAGARG